MVCAVVAVVVPCFGGKNLVTNGDFENGTTGWSARGGSIEAVEDPVYDGEGAAKATDRTDTWNGIKQDMMDKMEAGKTYKISGWATIEDGSGPVIVSIEKTDDSGTNYINIATAQVSDGEWAQISGEFTPEVDGDLATLDLYFEGPDADVDFFVDDVAVYAADDAADDDQVADEDEDEDEDENEDANDMDEEEED
jgi:hypothetical protein